MAITVLVVVAIAAAVMLQPPKSPPTAADTLRTTAAGFSTSPSAPVTIVGGGSTFINLQMQAWAARYKNLTQGMVTINYQAIGSGAGQAKWLEKALDFGASDVPIAQEIYQQLVSRGSRFVQFPVIAGAVAVIYNIPEWDEKACGPLRLTGEVLADIYMGKIIYWDDPSIAELQQGGCKNRLPHKPVLGIHRSDGSGTTFVLTLYFSNISQEWSSRVGSGFTVQWPRDQLGYGEGARGSDGVTAKVQSTPYSLGYVELGYAENSRLPVAALKNRDGFFVTPSSEGVSEALRRGARDLPPPDQYWGSVPLSFINKEGPKTYPLVGLTYVFAYTGLERSRAQALSDFFLWVLTEGQKGYNVVQGYEPLPDVLASKALEYAMLIARGAGR